MKIFVVVGTQEPFDRMIRAIDKWAGDNPGNEIFAQISHAGYLPVNMGYTDFITPDIFDQRFSEADLIVSHAGMGTIISALRNSKPIVVMPRLAQYHEHRNDHQLATAKSFEKLGYVNAAYTDTELFSFLSNAASLSAAPPIGSSASPALLSILKQFVEN